MHFIVFSFLFVQTLTTIICILFLFFKLRDCNDLSSVTFKYLYFKTLCLARIIMYFERINIKLLAAIISSIISTVMKK